MSKKRIGLVGMGYVGKAYNKVFPDAVVYDEPKKIGTREEINKCDMAIIAVPTDPKEDRTLDMSIVEDIISWIETPLILIKSALAPGTVDRLVKETGKKIAVSVEYIGMGSYFIPDQYPSPTNPRQHPMILVGGELETATACAEILWENVAPTTRIHLLSALECEISKLVENSYPALKVTFINCLMSLAQKSDSNFIRLQQAWTADPRVDGMHLRALSYKRGWSSHCWNKDIPALAEYAKSIGANDMEKLIDTVIEINSDHKQINEK